MFKIDNMEINKNQFSHNINANTQSLEINFGKDSIKYSNNTLVNYLII